MQHTVRWRWRPIGLIAALLLASTLALAGCGSIAPASSAPLHPIPVRVQLNWAHVVDWGAFYIADADGDYAGQGLALTLLVGRDDAQGRYIDPLTAVLEGRADFGITTGSDLLQARARGAPLVAVATIYQRHPLAFTSLAEKRIIRPQDLVGKTAQISPGSMPLFQALLAEQGIDPARVKTVERTDVTIAPLTKGEADVIDAWVTHEVVTLRQAGHAIDTILPIDYGIEEYPNVIFTTEKMIADRPDLIERFLRATLRGMQGMIDNPKRVPLLAKQSDPTLDPAQLSEATFQALPFLHPPGSRPGMMTGRTWESTQRILHDQGVVRQPLDVTKAYTLAFLEKIYAK